MTEEVSPKTFEGKRSGVVYGVYTPDNPHRCRYVGVTIQGLHRRAQGHWFQARKGAESRIARFLRETPDAVFRVIYPDVPDNFLNAFEAELVETLRHVGQADLNILDGGYCADKYVLWRDTTARTRQSEISLRNWSDPEWAERQRGLIRASFSDEFRAGASERMKSYWATGVINVRGEDKPSAKLTEEDVRAIRSSFTGAYGDKTALAREYKVALSTISSIINRETWKHV